MSYPEDDLQRLLLQSSSQQQGGGDNAINVKATATPTNATTSANPFNLPGGSATSIAEKLVFLAENERHSPEILPYPTELLAQLQSEMAQRRDEIESMRQQSHNDKQSSGGGGGNNSSLLLVDSAAADALLGIGGGNGGGASNNNDNSKNSQNTNPNMHIQISSSSTLPFRVEDLLNLEMTRLKYAVADLIRVRLQKIQFFRETILEKADHYREVLSENEFSLAQELSIIFTNAMQQGGLGLLPKEYRDEPTAAIATPNLNRYVLAIVLEQSEILLRGFDQPQVMNAGDCILCAYESVRRHLVDGRIRLM